MFGLQGPRFRIGIALQRDADAIGGILSANSV
jgi:hypothetical protein